MNRRLRSVYSRGCVNGMLGIGRKESGHTQKKKEYFSLENPVFLTVIIKYFYIKTEILFIHTETGRSPDEHDAK